MIILNRKDFQPDYANVLRAAQNIKPNRMPIYEHLISPLIMERIMNKKFADLYYGNRRDKKEFLRNYCHFFKREGYDTVSFEVCITTVINKGESLIGHKPGIIRNMEDFKKYDWESLHDAYFEECNDYFTLLGEVMPDGMKAIGGPGNGVFECVQDFVGYMDLCYMGSDDPQLYALIFDKVGEVMGQIWKTFLEKYGDVYTVCRFGDDLGFRSSTLLSDKDIKSHILPQYKRIVDLVHSHNKPFLLHSCGKIFDVMEDIISYVGIDAKHSNEDSIAPFTEWVEKYGDRIGNFGGVDMDVLCRNSTEEIGDIVRTVIDNSINHGGFALGSGNSIPDYVPVEGYLAMIEAARETRGE